MINNNVLLVFLLKNNLIKFSSGYRYLKERNNKEDEESIVFRTVFCMYDTYSPILVSTETSTVITGISQLKA